MLTLSACAAGTAAASGSRKLLAVQTQQRHPARRLLAWDSLASEQWVEVWEDNGPQEFNPGFFTRHLLQTVRPTVSLSTTWLWSCIVVAHAAVCLLWGSVQDLFSISMQLMAHGAATANHESARLHREMAEP